MTMKGFDEHKDACNYAKANPGFIVIRDGQEWIVGEKLDIWIHIERRNYMEEVRCLEGRMCEAESPEDRIQIQRRQETTEERIRRLEQERKEGRLRKIEQDSIIWPVMPDWESYTGEKDWEMYQDEIRAESDPDDWNRSTEEGWFYDDDTTPPSEPQS